ncbi:MAG: DPP IV N-terminal domain-containing protein [Bacteroidota bacterium]
MIRFLLSTFLFLLSCQIIYPQQRDTKKEITLEDIWQNNTFQQKTILGVRSMKDGIHYTTLAREKGTSYIIKYKYETGEVSDTILRSEWLVVGETKDTISIDDYQFSSDENKILIATEIEHIYRHSTREKNYVWDRMNKKLTLLSDGSKQRYATFSPSGSKAAFVRENNLFLKDLGTGREIQITKDGIYNQIINGATDWVYEEEFSFDKAFFWSPDGSKIAYYRFDESNVKEFSMVMYGTLYPENYKFKYPKAGEENAKVTIHIYDLINESTITADLGSDFEYIPRIKWTKDPDFLSIQRMNRHQNKLELLLANTSTGGTKTILTEESDTYIDITDDLTFLDDKKHFIRTSESDGYNHIYLYDLKGKLMHQITKGNRDVIKFKGIDEHTKTLFYISAGSSPMARDIYSIKIDGKGKKKLSDKKGQNDAQFSKGFKYYINNHSDANTPAFITLHNAAGKQIRILEDNGNLKETLKQYLISKKEFFNFKTSEGIELNGWMIKPSNFDSTKKHPVMMYVYGGPGAQTVRDSWNQNNYLWHQMLAQKGCIIVSVDNRGTEARGADFKKCTYKELGKLETIDQIEVVKYLRTLPYVDKQRFGIWGWSYGGYLTSLCLTKGADYFKLGIAVAPSTSWRFYDTIYTERYMQTPQENPDGYDDNSPVNHVEKLKGKYLIIHGTADDNVHYQNTIEMVSALVKANKQFDLFVYPDKNHGIYGGNTRLHLYTKMTNFILDNL